MVSGLSKKERREVLLEGLCWMFEVFRQERQALVEELPVKCPTGSLILRPVGKRLIVNDVYEGAHH